MASVGIMVRQINFLDDPVAVNELVWME